MTFLLADWSNVFFHIHDYCRSGMLVCHFEMCAVGERCALFSSTREVNSYFGRGNGVDVWGREISWRPFSSTKWLVSYSSTQNTGSKSFYHVRLSDSDGYISFTRMFPHLRLFLMQVLFILFSGSRRLKTGKSEKKHMKIKGI